jgi:glycosyltransferase involved in cell wall biosynthesis
VEAPRVQIINNFRGRSGIWGHARELKQALGDRARLTTILTKVADYSYIDRSISEIEGDLPLPVWLRARTNYLFPAITMRRFTRECRELVRSGGILHYVATEIRPWVDEGKISVTFNGSPAWLKGGPAPFTVTPALRWALRTNIRHYEKVATAMARSGAVLAGVRELGYGGPVIVVHPAVDPRFRPASDSERAAFRKELGVPLDRKVLLSVSTAEYQKNLPVMPKVMDLLPPEYLLVRVGPPVRGALTFSTLSEEALAKLFACSDAFLMPTFWEGFPLPAAEAFSSGLPVVTSTIPVMDEVCAGAALQVDPNDPAQLATACRRAIDERAAWVPRVLQRAQHVTPEAYRERVLAYFDKVGR